MNLIEVDILKSRKIWSNAAHYPNVSCEPIACLPHDMISVVSLWYKYERIDQFNQYSRARWLRKFKFCLWWKRFSNSSECCRYKINPKMFDYSKSEYFYFRWWRLCSKLLRRWLSISAISRRWPRLCICALDTSWQSWSISVFWMIALTFSAWWKDWNALWTNVSGRCIVEFYSHWNRSKDLLISGYQMKGFNFYASEDAKINFSMKCVMIYATVLIVPMAFHSVLNVIYDLTVGQYNLDSWKFLYHGVCVFSESQFSKWKT